MNTLIQQVARCIEREHLLDEEQHTYVAVSGGADSVALLTALRMLGYRLTALHCNFHLRGEESMRDETFVRTLCISWGIPCEVKSFDTLGYAHKQQISIEMAARELRYAWFAQIWQADTSSRIAIAHNSNDLAETLLYNLAQGTGIRGLAGIPYKRDKGIIRPLLDCSRQEILHFLDKLPDKPGYCTDSSNQDTSYKRNFIRHRLLPVFEELKPGATQQIAISIRQLRGAERYYRESIERYKALVLDSKGIKLEPLKTAPDSEALLFELLSPYGFSSSQCYQIADDLGRNNLGASYYSPSHRLVRSWQYLELIARDGDSPALQELSLDQVPCSLSLKGWHIECQFSSVAVIDRKDILCLPLRILRGKRICLRSPHEGERIQPFGMKGTKRISRILIDAKAEHRLRSDALLLAVDDTPLWLLDYCKSEHTRLEPKPTAETEGYLMISYIRE